MQFLGRQNPLKYVFGGGSALRTPLGSSERSPMLIAALRGHTCKERKRVAKKVYKGKEGNKK